MKGRSISHHRPLLFRRYQVQFDRGRDPVFTSFIELGIEKVVGDQYYTMEVKQGATIWGMIKPYEIPWMVSIRPGGPNAGMQWLLSHTFERWWAGENNPYSLDMATNIIFYSLADLPDFPHLSELMLGTIDGVPVARGDEPVSHFNAGPCRHLKLPAIDIGPFTECEVGLPAIAEGEGVLSDVLSLVFHP